MLDNNSEKCIFVGYSEKSKAYHFYNLATNSLVISNDAIFDKHEAWNWTPKTRNVSVPMLDHMPIEEGFDNSRHVNVHLLLSLHMSHLRKLHLEE